MSLAHPYAHSSPSGGDGHILPGCPVHLHYIARGDNQGAEDALSEVLGMDILDLAPRSVLGQCSRRRYCWGEGIAPWQSTGAAAGGRRTGMVNGKGDHGLSVGRTEGVLA